MLTSAAAELKRKKFYEVSQNALTSGENCCRYFGRMPSQWVMLPRVERLSLPSCREEEHLRRAWMQDETYYKKKYGGLRKRSIVLIQRIGLWLDGFLWGHGEKLWNLPISALIVLVFFAAISAALWATSVTDPSIYQFFGTFKAYTIYYISLFLDAPYEANLSQVIYLDWMVVIFRYLSLGILVSGLFRWLSHR